MPTAKSSAKPSSSSSKLPIFFLLLTVGLLAAGGYYVYSTFKGNGSSMSNPLDLAKQVATGGNMMMPKASENDFKDIDDPLIRKHLAAQINIGKYRIHSTSSGMDKGTEQIMEFVMSGNDVHYRMNQKMNGKDSLDMITIGDTTYLKDYSDGKWWKQTAKPSNAKMMPQEQNEEEQFKPMDLKEEYMKSNVSYKSLGEEACGSLTCYKYEEHDGADKEATRTFWFDTKDLLLRKEVNGFGEFSSTQEYSYDNLSVTVPAPTKDVPEGQSIYDLMISSMTGIDTTGAEMHDLQKMMPTKENMERMMKEQESGDYTPEDTYTDTPENY